MKERDGEARPEISFESERSDPSILAPSNCLSGLSAHKGLGCSRHPELHEGQVGSRSGRGVRVASQLSPDDLVHHVMHSSGSQTSAICLQTHSH